MKCPFNVVELMRLALTYIRISMQKENKLTENSHKSEDWDLQASVVYMLQIKTQNITSADSSKLRLRLA